MSENNRKDIFSRQLDYSHIALLSSKIRVLVVGGGKAGFIKSKSFLNKGCEVTVLSKDFSKLFEELKERIVVITGEYSKQYILDKHIIVIAVEEEDLISEIIRDCDTLSKLYINCKNFKKGNMVMPMQVSTKNITFSINTKAGSPKTSKFLAKVLEDKLEAYGTLVEYSCNLREEIKNSPYKDEIMAFVSSEDFKFFLDKGFEELVLGMFYKDELFGKGFKEIVKGNRDK